MSLLGSAALWVGLILYAAVMITIIMGVGFLVLRVLLNFYDYLTDKLQ